MSIAALDSVATLPPGNDVIRNPPNPNLFQHAQFAPKTIGSSLLSFPVGVSPSPLPTIEQPSASRFVNSRKLDFELNIFDQSFKYQNSQINAAIVGLPNPPSDVMNNILDLMSPKVILPPPTPSPRNTQYDRFDSFPFPITVTKSSPPHPQPIKREELFNPYINRVFNNQNLSAIQDQPNNAQVPHMFTQTLPAIYGPSQTIAPDYDPRINNLHKQPIHDPSFAATTALAMMQNMDGFQISQNALSTHFLPHHATATIPNGLRGNDSLPMIGSHHLQQPAYHQSLQSMDHPTLIPKIHNNPFIPTKFDTLIIAAENNSSTEFKPEITVFDQFQPAPLIQPPVSMELTQINNPMESGLQILNAAAVAVSVQDHQINSSTLYNHENLFVQPQPQPSSSTTFIPRERSISAEQALKLNQIASGNTLRTNHVKDLGAIPEPAYFNNAEHGDWPMSNANASAKVVGKKRRTKTDEGIVQNKRSRTVSESSKISELKTAMTRISSSGGEEVNVNSKSTKSEPTKRRERNLSSSSETGLVDEKRKNFLERNRQAALKCRQKKKQWVQDLQNKVEYLNRDNEILKDKSKILYDEINMLKRTLNAHKTCEIALNNGLNLKRIEQEIPRRTV